MTSPGAIGCRAWKGVVKSRPVTGHYVLPLREILAAGSDHHLVARRRKIVVRFTGPYLCHGCLHPEHRQPTRFPDMHSISADRLALSHLVHQTGSIDKRCVRQHLRQPAVLVHVQPRHPGLHPNRLRPQPPILYNPRQQVHRSRCIVVVVELDVSHPPRSEYSPQFHVRYVDCRVSLYRKHEAGIPVRNYCVVSGQVVQVGKVRDQKHVYPGFPHQLAHLGYAPPELLLGKGKLRGCRILL